MRTTTRRGRVLGAACGVLLWLVVPATAQQQPPPAQQQPPPAQQQPPKEEVPFWAVGRPSSGPGAALAPIPAFPIPTPADKLPIAKMKVPAGFRVEVYAANIFDARGLRQGEKGTVFVSSLFGAGKIYAIVDKGGTREVKTICSGRCASTRAARASATAAPWLKSSSG